MTSGVGKMIDGYRRFRTGPFEASRPLIETLVAEGQHPEVCVVACADSRVDPGIVFQSDPGDLFIIRNVANLVPPMEEEGAYHGTSAALEFAVRGLGVKHLVVLGHAHCGGVKAMMTASSDDDAYTFLPSWVSMLSAAYHRVLATMPDAGVEEQTRACERNAVLVSLENLTTFPWVRERVESGALRLHGWYIDIATATLSTYDGEAGNFEPVN